MGNAVPPPFEKAIVAASLSELNNVIEYNRLGSTSSLHSPILKCFYLYLAFCIIWPQAILVPEFPAG